jgi:two-component system, sensor histidine kinase and response regulator
MRLPPPPVPTGTASQPKAGAAVAERTGELRGRVLLVEDNPINQGVAKAMLRRLGLSMALAMHGGEAVELVRTQTFDLVLMDCQMPVMDGFAATAAIRALPGGRGVGLPVIALTANALEGDEASCLRAGMDAFLAKPYTLVALRAMLARWLDGTPAIDPAVFDTLRELDPSGGDDLAREVFQTFLDCAEPAMARIEAAVAEGDARLLGQVAHSLKSSTANVGARGLSDGHRVLEACARENRMAEAPDLLVSVQREHARALVELRAWLEGSV